MDFLVLLRQNIGSNGFIIHCHRSKIKNTAYNELSTILQIFDYKTEFIVSKSHILII
jgi:hypothetical protein